MKRKTIKNMPDLSGLDKRFSDFVGSINYENSNNLKQIINI